MRTSHKTCSMTKALMEELTELFLEAVSAAESNGWEIPSRRSFEEAVKRERQRPW